jgi:hypothetical protein
VCGDYIHFNPVKRTGTSRVSPIGRIPHSIATSQKAGCGRDWGVAVDSTAEFGEYEDP